MTEHDLCIAEKFADAKMEIAVLKMELVEANSEIKRLNNKSINLEKLKTFFSVFDELIYVKDEKKNELLELLK